LIFFFIQSTETGFFYATALWQRVKLPMPVYLYRRPISFHSSPVARARCEIILVCRGGMLPVRRMPSSSLTSRTRHNKGLSATDGGWPAPVDPVFSQTPTRTLVQTRVIVGAAGSFKDHHLSGKWKKKVTDLLCT